MIECVSVQVCEGTCMERSYCGGALRGFEGGNSALRMFRKGYGGIVGRCVGGCVGDERRGYPWDFGA